MVVDDVAQAQINDIRSLRKGSVHDVWTYFSAAICEVTIQDRASDLLNFVSVPQPFVVLVRLVRCQWIRHRAGARTSEEGRSLTRAALSRCESIERLGAEA